MPNDYQQQKWGVYINEVKRSLKFISIDLNWIESDVCNANIILSSFIWNIIHGQQVICCTEQWTHWNHFFGSFLIQHSLGVAAVYHQSTESALLSSHVNHQPRAQFSVFFCSKQVRGKSDRIDWNASVAANVLYFITFRFNVVYDRISILNR